MDDYKDEPYLNGYDGANYSILITMFPPDAKDRVTRLLKTTENIFFDVEKKKGNSQFTSGIHVPSVLNKSPFASNVPKVEDIVKNYIKKPTDNMNINMVEDTSPRALLANAFEGLAQNDIEKNKIREYKEKVELINAEEQKLR